MKKQNQEQVEHLGKLNEVIIKETRRKDGSLRIQQDFSNCPTLAEQHTAHLSDINWLITKYKPDELAAYIAARSQHRQEILGHDFSQEPNLQDAKDQILRMRKAFDDLDPEIKNQFASHLEFLKFIDNPANQERMLKLGLLKKKDIQQLSTEGTAPPVTGTTPPLTPTSPSLTKS